MTLNEYCRRAQKRLDNIKSYPALYGLSIARQLVDIIVDTAIDEIDLLSVSGDDTVTVKSTQVYPS